ncbi:MAG: CHAD domain-containing protein, partial [Bacteroidales bacterium]|nr:CHAD domain-containing protein [Bacteroidales bacterium]
MDQDTLRIKEIKPALSGYLRESLLLLQGDQVPDDNAIHDIRVLMKKARAALKLLHPCLGDKVFNDEYKTYRDAARMLAAWRDLSVQRKTLRSIRKSNRKLFSRLKGYKPLDVIMNMEIQGAEGNLNILGNIK